MFEPSTMAAPPDHPSRACDVMLSTAELEALVTRLSWLDAKVDDAERVTQLTLMEKLKGAAAAAQARVTVDLDVSQRELQARQGMPADQLGRGVADQIALARRDSKAKGSRHLGLAKALVREMPHTMAALTAGEITEWRATIVARETAVLSREDRGHVDAGLAPDLATLGDAQLAARAKAIAYALDATSALCRARGAVSDRRVSIRPAPDTMSLVTGFLPVVQGVAVHASLTRAAAAAHALGDPRSKGQIMADTFVERITGQATADGVPLEVQLIMTDRSLLAGESTPAQIPGFGPVPAAFARDLIAGQAGDRGWADVTQGNSSHGDRWREDGRQAEGPHGDVLDGAGRQAGGRQGDVVGENARPADVWQESAEEDAGGPGDGGHGEDGHAVSPDEPQAAELVRVWLRRLFTSPDETSLVAMDARRRTFDGLLRQFLIARDQICRTPWCDAPIRHIDHIAAVAGGGETSAANGQGLCARCNYTKELAGWRTEVIAGSGRHRVRTTTPTGHTYESTAPPPLGLLVDPTRGRSSPDHDDGAGVPGRDHRDNADGSPLTAAFEQLLRVA